MSQVNHTAAIAGATGAVVVEPLANDTTMNVNILEHWKECWKAAGYKEDDFIHD